jgi:hypothetical protein
VLNALVDYEIEVDDSPNPRWGCPTIGRPGQA